MLLVMKYNLGKFNPRVKQPLISEGKIIPLIFKIGVLKKQAPSMVTLYAEITNQLFETAFWEEGIETFLCLLHLLSQIHQAPLKVGDL